MEPREHTAPQGPSLDTRSPFEERLTRDLQRATEQIQFTPEMRERILQRVTQPRRRVSGWGIGAVGVALLALVVLAVTVLPGWLHPQPAGPAPIQYRVAHQTTAPAGLAHGGTLVALDPTQQHLVYQPADQQGVFYTASLSDPVSSDVLAMQAASDMAWAPDGSAIAAVVKPEGTTIPLLALVPTGQYMHLLGPTALAASWSPQGTQQIVYALPAPGATQLWGISPDGLNSQLLATLSNTLDVEHLLWSPDGHWLAFVVGSGTSAQNQSARAIYLMNMQTNALQELIAPSAFTLGNVSWSPDSKQLAYERSDPHGTTTLSVLTIATGHTALKVTLHTSLAGWCWSPDSRALVYSDGKTLHGAVLHGSPLAFPASSGSQIDPFWLANGQILYMQVTRGMGKLSFLQKVVQQHP